MNEISHDSLSCFQNAGWPSFSELTNTQVDKWCILQHTGINETDLLHINLTESQRPSIHLPCHFLAVDHATKSIVLAIRGTRSLKDTVVNLMCDNIPFCGGQVCKILSMHVKLYLQMYLREGLNRLIEAWPKVQCKFMSFS